MKAKLLLVILFLVSNSFAQENLSYQKPSKEILELADVDLAPGVQIDSKGENMVLIYRNQYKSIAELSETEMRLAGLRINPVTNIGSRTTFYTNLKVKKTGDKNAWVESISDTVIGTLINFPLNLILLTITFAME